MSEHSIEELERQLKQADDRAKEANQRAAEARRRFMDAKFEVTGFKGCIAEYKEHTWRKGETVVRFLPQRVSRWGDAIEGPMLKKDGTPGIVTKRCGTKEAANLGPYKPDEAPHA